LKQFSVIRLRYDLLDIPTVMNWYDKAVAPFREGKKRKEFPDAFVIAMLAAYAQREGVYIAVMSSDQDFKAACQRFNSLLHFPSLPRLTEVLLSDDERTGKMRLAIEEKIDVVEVAVLEQVPGIPYYHTDNRFDIEEVEPDRIDLEP